MQSCSAILLLCCSELIAGYLLPHPFGTYNVTLTTGTLVDCNRDDPYAATPIPRALMLSIFQPATCVSVVPVEYMPSNTADYQGTFLQQTFNISADLTPVFLQARLPVCPDHSDKCSSPEDWPILLLSPGYAIPRLYWNVLASAIASEGFIVITIDHPEDANIITYPDGHTIYNNDTTSDDPTKNEHVRAADASFIIDQLSNATAMAELLPQRGRRPFATNRVAMLGHSLGGATALIAAARDTRIRGVVSWDSPIFGSLPQPGVSQPVLLMAQPNDAHDEWSAVWPQLKGPKMWVNIANTTHQTFLDGPTLLEAAGQDLEPYLDLLGTIAPSRMVRILTTFTSTWMTGAFSGEEAGLPLADFKEVTVVRQGNFNKRYKSQKREL